MTMKFQVGQGVWLQYWPGHGPSGVTAVSVKGVGRKWVTLSNGIRFDRSTLVATYGGSSRSIGKVWIDRDDFETETRRCVLWADLLLMVGCNNAILASDLRKVGEALLAEYREEGKGR